MPQHCVSYLIPNRSNLVLETFAVVVFQVNIFKALIIPLKYFFEFDRKYKTYNFFKKSPQQFINMMLAYLYVNHIFRDKLKVTNNTEDMVILIPAIYSPYGLIVADFCVRHKLTFADLQHGDCTVNLFYSEQYIKKLQSFFGSTFKFYVRSRNRFLYFANLLPFCDLEVIYEPLICPQTSVNRHDEILICLPYTSNELKFFTEMLTELSSKVNSERITVRPHPRILDNKHIMNKLNTLRLSIDTSSIVDFRRTRYLRYFTFQSSIIFSIPTTPKDIVVFRDIDETPPKYANYFESIEEAARFGCLIEDPQNALNYIEKYLS